MPMGAKNIKTNKGFSPHWMSVKLPDNFQMSEHSATHDKN
jgi:hypothetical protein